MRKPQKLPLDAIYRCLPDNIRQNRKQLSYHNGMGVVINVDNSLFRMLKLAGSPFIIDDYRMGMLVRGKMRGMINLREYTMTAGTIVFITPGTIVEPLEISDDFLLDGMGLPADMFLLAHGGRLPELFNGQIHDGRMLIGNDHLVFIDRMLRLLHDFVDHGDTSDSVIYNMVSTITNYYDQMFCASQPATAPSHSGEIFNKFLRLVNIHGSREHQLAFYADQLCITSRYLGTIVQATSGVGAKDWIDRAIISKAKVMLRHSDRQAAQIADELNFPNASFFCKYFKRLTGVTPLQYRRGEDAVL